MAGRVRRVLVAADASPAGQAAIARAAQVAGRAGARATVVFVRHVGRTKTNVDPAFVSETVADEMWSRFDGVRDRVWAAGARAFDSRGIEWELTVRTGSPGVEILRAADEAQADLIVIGRGRERAAADPDAAATARYVAAHARVRVLAAAPGTATLVA
jgi:nucleotide-binding universal stress UspA family protein